MKSKPQDHLYGIYQILNSRINLIARSIGHSTLQGTEVENEIKKLLIDLLPHNYGVSDGIIIGTDGSQSKQIDIVIYDKNKPNYTLLKDSKIFLSDHVLAAIEIKTTYDSEPLNDSLKNMKSVRELNLSKKIWKKRLRNREYELSSTPPATIVFFFDKKKTKKAVNLSSFECNFRKKIEEIDEDLRPDLVFSLSHGFMYRWKYYVTLGLHRKGAEEKFLMSFVQKCDNKNQVLQLVDLTVKDALGQICRISLKDKRHLVDFSGDSRLLTSSSRMDGISISGHNLCKEGGSDQAIFYEIATYKDKKGGEDMFLLIDKYRAFLNFIYFVEHLIREKEPNPEWNATDYFGTNQFNLKDLDKFPCE